VSFLQGSQAALNTLVTEDGQLLLAGNGSALSTITLSLLTYFTAREQRMYADRAGGITEENSSVFSECAGCRQQGHAGSKILLQQKSSSSELRMPAIAGCAV